MKQFVLITLILLFSINQAFAYSVKVYNKEGVQIGTVHKENDAYIIYDKDGNRLETDEQLYSPPGVPVSTFGPKKFWRTDYNGVWIIRH